MCEAGLCGRIPAKKQRLKDKNKMRLAWAKKHEKWTLDWWKSVLLSDESKFEIVGSNRCVFVRHIVSERRISACVVPTVKHGGGGVMVWACLAGDTDLFIIEGSLTQNGYHSILQRCVITSGLHLMGLSSVFQQDNDPTHLQAV